MKKSMKIISEQLKRLKDVNGSRYLLVNAIETKYKRNIIDHFGGYKDETEFTNIYHKEVTREIYAGY